MTSSIFKIILHTCACHEDVCFKLNGVIVEVKKQGTYKYF